jgi:hypothetical protein
VDGTTVDERAVVAALERYVLSEGDRVESARGFLDGFRVKTDWTWYQILPADWRISRAPWTTTALRVTEDPPIPAGLASTYGLLRERGGDVSCLNEVRFVRDLGRRIGQDLDPLAYAEILAEFYSSPDIDGPIVRATAPSRSSRAGWLVGPTLAIEEYEWIDRALLKPPVVERVGTTLTIDFTSIHHRGHSMPPAVDVLRWLVTAERGREPTWSRTYLAQELEMP